ncbi:MAG: YadA C-terminal domain-containing protein, partial [Synergistes sp.]|nr:YadA C-terminal domain-containing protein [Synergistes sp.]
KQSVAVGLFHYVKESVLLNAGVSLNGDGDTMGRVGVSFALGKGGGQTVLPVKAEAMQKRIAELEERNERNEAMIKEMAEMIKSLQAKIDK